MTGELKLCPMCEGTVDYVGREGQGYWVECKQCLTRGPWGDYGYQAKDGWNKRPSPPPPSQHREPIEADREAAASLIRTYWAGGGHEKMHQLADSIENGSCRHDVFTQAFMRHRLAFSTPAASDAEGMREACAIAARDALVAHEWPPQDGDRQIDEVLAAIRALPLPKAGEGEA